MGNCCKIGNYTELFSRIQPAPWAPFLQICIFSPVFWKCLPTTIVPFQGKGRSKENKKGSFFGFAGLLVAVSRCRPLKWVHGRKVSVITDSSHHEALWGLAPECWEGQNSMHQVCNYLAKINTFFTEFHTVFRSADWITMGCSETRDCWVSQTEIEIHVCYDLGVCLDLWTFLVRIVFTKERFTFLSFLFLVKEGLGQ